MPDSSPESEIELKPDAASAAEGTEQDAKATSEESSPAEKPGQKGDMLTAVKAALQPKEDSPDSANQGSEKDASKAAGKDGAEEEDDSGDFSEEEKARFSQKARRRFEKLSGQVTDLTKHIGDLEPKAQRFDQMVRFVSDAGLSPDEVNRGLDVMAAIKQNPLKAFEMLTPVYEQLRQVVGEVLPDDLRNAVALGQLTEDHARELARSRSAATLREQQLQRFEQRSQAERQHTEVSNRWNSAASATTEWENSKAKSDPDWKLKQPRVIELIELDLLKRKQANPNFVPTDADAVAMANSALEKVNEDFKRLRPKPKQVNTITDVASSRSSAKPKTLLEAAKEGLKRAHAG